VPLLSIIIPSYKDPLLARTIDDLLRNAKGEIEIIPVLDGYEPQDPCDIVQDYRVRPVFLRIRSGMREAINAGVRASSGQFIMRTDEHCSFAEGFDIDLTGRIKNNWIVVPLRYDLNVETWETEGKPKGYEKLIIGNWKLGKKFHSRGWPARDRKRRQFPIDETMAMQGSCWVMSRWHWDRVIDELDPAYGTLYQDSVEMVFKTWKAGGKLMLNKLTWYAHKARRFKRTHHYPDTDAKQAFEYSLELWEDYYRKVVKPKWGI
jgi:glycosyltransferase involved in cell wall biosynthesis